MSDEYIKKEDILKFIEGIKCNKDIPKNYGTLIDIMGYIRKMPTYDVDSVIQELENEKTNFIGMGTLQSAYFDKGIDKSIEIVKSGGVSDE